MKNETMLNNKLLTPGTHLIIDFWEAKSSASLTSLQKILREAAQACGATVLHILLHPFGNNAGITGVAILAESHISIHTWPELHYVAIDIFVCGACDPHLALPILRNYFKPKREKIQAHLRGIDKDDQRS